MSKINKLIAILLIATFTLPVQAIQAADYGIVTVKFNFTDYSGNPITAYSIIGKIYNDEGTQQTSVWYNSTWNNSTVQLNAFTSYKIEMTLCKDFNTTENDIKITRSFKTRLGYKTVNIKLPATAVIEWKAQLQVYENKAKTNFSNNDTAYIELYNPETNKLIKSETINAGTATINIPPDVYNVVLKGNEIDTKVLNNFHIYKEKTSNITVNKNETKEIIFVFNNPLKYKAQITVDQEKNTVEEIPEGYQDWTMYVKAGKPFNVTIHFGVNESNPKKQGTFEKQYTIYSNKTVNLWEFDYAKYLNQKEWLTLDICSTDLGNKTVTVTDPVYKTVMSENEMIGSSCIRASGEKGDITVEKYTKVKIEVYNKEIGKKEERTITVTNTQQIVFGSSSSTATMEKLITINVYEAGSGTNTSSTPITNWKGTIRRISDSEFVGGTTYSNGDKDITIDNSRMIYLPKDTSQYEMTISADGFMQEVKRFRAFGPKTINVYMTRSSQLKPVTLKLETVSDNKGLIIKDIYMYASYYYKDKTDTLQQDTLEIGGNQIPIEAIVSSTATKWEFTVNLPENKSVYLSPVIYFESGTTSFTYVGKPQKHSITSLQSGSSQEINMPINVIGTAHKIVVIEKQSGDKNVIDNLPVQITQVYPSESSYGIKEFKLESNSTSDQTVWLPDGIFIEALFTTTNERDIFKYQRTGTNTFAKAVGTVKSKTYKTPIQYDKSKYEMPAIVMSYESSLHHAVNAKIKVKIEIEEETTGTKYNFGSTKIEYDLRKAFLTVTSADKKYKDSIKIPTWSSDETDIEWIIGLPEAKTYEAKLTIPYKVKTGDKNIYNSKGDLWKTVPVYERKEEVITQEITASGDKAGVIVEFRAKLKPSGDKISINDKSDTQMLSPLESGCIPYGSSGNIVLYACGSYLKEEICSRECGWWGCGEVGYKAIVTNYSTKSYKSEEQAKDVLKSYGGGFFNLKEDNGKIKTYSLNKFSQGSGFNEICQTDYYGNNVCLQYITNITDISCSHITVGGINQKTYTVCHEGDVNNCPADSIQSSSFFGNLGGMTTLIGMNFQKSLDAPPDFKKYEKKITLRIRNKNPKEVFSMSNTYIDPSKRDSSGGEDKLIYARQNTYVEFQDADEKGNYTSRMIKKVWIEKALATQYQKTWALPINPEREVWIKVILASIKTGNKKEIIQKAGKGNNVTVDFEYDSDVGEVELTPGAKYEVTGSVDVDSTGTVHAYIAQGTGIVLKISGMKCENDNKECYNATKAIMNKIKYSYNNPNAKVYVSVDSTVRDNYGALKGRLYINDTDVAQELIDQGIIVNVKSESDRNANVQGTKNLIIKVKAGNNSNFSGKKVYVAVNPEFLPTMRKLTQGTTGDAYAYWGGLEHELQVNPSNQGETKETTIKIDKNTGDNVKLLFYTSDMKGFIEKTWLAQLIKEKTEDLYQELDIAINEFASENIERSAKLKQGSFTTAVKNITVTTANYQYVNVTIPTLGESTYTDFKTITVNINATSTGGFRANLLDLTAAASIVGMVDTKKSAIEKFKEKTYLQKDAFDYSPTYTDNYNTYENKRYKVTYYKDGSTWKSVFYDKVDKIEIPADSFTGNVNRNTKLIKAWEKAANSTIMKAVRALTLQPFTKWVSKAFSALGSWGEAAYRWAITLGMGMPLSGMPLVKIQTSMESKNGVMEATNASTSFQVKDWFRNFFNKPLVAKTLSVQIKARKYGKIIVRMAAMGHEPYTSIFTINESVWTNGSVDIYASMKTNLAYSYTSFEAFMSSFPLLQERIEEFALAPEMYATSSERASLVDYMAEGIETMMDSFIKDFTPFMNNPKTGSICESQPWLPECVSGSSGNTGGGVM